MKKEIAKYISVIGNPLFTIPLFVVIVMFKFEDFEKAAFISFLIVGCIFVPLITRMYLKSRNGTYTNFDISNRVQRKSLFLFALPLVIIVTAVLYKTGQSQDLLLSVFFGLLLVFISQIVNLYIKSSLHVSLNIFLSFLLMALSIKIALIAFLITGLIGWSRITLGRHTLIEVLCGGGIGLIIGFLMFYVRIIL